MTRNDLGFLLARGLSVYVASRSIELGFSAVTVFLMPSSIEQSFLTDQLPKLSILLPVVGASVLLAGRLWISAPKFGHLGPTDSEPAAIRRHDVANPILCAVGLYIVSNNLARAIDTWARSNVTGEYTAMRWAYALILALGFAAFVGGGWPYLRPFFSSGQSHDAD